MKMETLKEKTGQLFRQWDGRLTRDLLQQPGRFGLGRVPGRLKPDATTTMTCGFCSTGCGLNIHLRDGEAANLTPTTNYPVNLGMACPKGWEALAPLRAKDRAISPMLRTERGKLSPVGWDKAMAVFCERFKNIQARHGPDSLAFLSTGQICTEELAFLGALTRMGMGIHHGDGNTRQCMATSVVAYKQSFGFDAPPYTYQDFEESDTIVLVGSNLCIAHPIMWERIARNPHQPKVLVVDPRKTETAMAASHHYPIAPKADLAFFYGIARLLISRGAIDEEYIRQHTAEFDAFADHVQSYTVPGVAGICGLEAAQIEEFADLIQSGKRVSFWWTMGVNQSHEGVRVAQSLINLALMTGNMGRPGTGANSITGQCNAMGSRLFSNTTNLLGGHDFANPAHRQKVAEVLGMDPARIPQQPSTPYDRIIEGISAGRIKGLWVIATNSAHSWINQSDFRRVMAKLDFLVVQDMYHSTETAGLADLVLPAAGWGEKEGTFINSERRLGLVKRVSRSPGLALSDFNIFRLVAEAWGCAPLFRHWQRPEDVFRTLQKLSAGQPCDITGIDGYRHLDEAGGIQWPYSGQKPEGNQRRLFVDGRFHHADGRARFKFSEPAPLPEPTTATWPFVLLTGRGTSAQWHTQTRTGKSAILRTLYPRRVYVEIHPEDARRLRIRPNEWVVVDSRRGQLRARASVTTCVQPGQCFIPMHYGVTNQLTYPAFDPHSRQPSYKHCAVNIRREAYWE